MNPGPGDPTIPPSHENPTLATRLLAVVTDQRVGVLASLTVAAILALPHPLPELPAVAYLAVGVAEGVGLAVVAENVLWRPAKRLRFRRASRAVGTGVAATGTFVVAMVAFGVVLSLRDWALLAGVSVSTPAAVVAIDALKSSARRA